MTASSDDATLSRSDACVVVTETCTAIGLGGWLSRGRGAREGGTRATETSEISEEEI